MIALNGMTKTRRRSQAFEEGKGFTLLEVLISIGILAVILSVIYGSYHSSVLTIQHVRTSSDLSRTARLILDRMSDDIRGAYLSSFSNPSTTVKFGFKGEDQWDGAFPADILNFTSTTHRLYDRNLPESLFSEIGYFLENDQEKGVKKLMRRESSVVDEDITTGGTGVEMGLRIRGLDLKYLDNTNQMWDTWDSTTGEQANKLPRVVEIHLFISKEDDDPTQQPREIVAKVFLEMGPLQQAQQALQ